MCAAGSTLTSASESEVPRRDSGFTNLLTDASRFRFESGALRATRRTLCLGCEAAAGASPLTCEARREAGFVLDRRPAVSQARDVGTRPGTTAPQRLARRVGG